MPLRASLAAILVAIIWGVNFVVIDWGLDGMPPTLFVAMRFVALIVPAIFFIPKPAARWRDILLLGTFMSMGQFGLLYTAMHLGMPPGLASLVLQAQVAFTVLFAALALRERPSTVQTIGVGVGAIGLVTVGIGRDASIPLVALLVTLAAAASWAIGNVIARRIAPASGGSIRTGLSITVWSALVVPVPLAALSLVIDGPAAVGHALTHLSVPQFVATGYTAWITSLVGYGIWNTLLSRYAASAVVPFTMLVPVVGMLAAWLIQGETPSLAALIGGAILLLGVACASGAIRFGRARTPVPEQRR